MIGICMRCVQHIQYQYIYALFIIFQSGAVEQLEQRILRVSISVFHLMEIFDIFLTKNGDE